MHPINFTGRRKENMFALKSLTTFVAAFVLAASSLVSAETFKCPNVFGNNMVLQRDKVVPIWGWAKAGSDVTVTFAGQSKTAKANGSGRWQVELDKMDASSESRDLVITSEDQTVKLTNVLVGEVWLASGQSNMEFGLGGSTMPKEELAKLNKPLIRIITVAKSLSVAPEENLTGNWQLLNNQSGSGSSAVACYFAMKLQDELNVPVGILSSSWGGTRIEPWTPADGFDMVPELNKMADSVRAMNPTPETSKAYIATFKDWVMQAEAAVANGRTLPAVPQSNTAQINNKTPGALYNAMIHPLVGYAMRGAIWYQGESNMGEGLMYEKKMQAMVGGWRKLWNQGDFPFYMVQLAPFVKYSGPALGGLWEAQMFATRSINNCGMAVTTDIGDLKNIHPSNKSDVGKRLALWALAKDYPSTVLKAGGKAADLVYSGPLYKSFEVKDNAIVISFEHAASGLAFKGEEITDVYIKGEGDLEFVKATPTIEGSTLVVTHPNGKKPLHVRMGWNKNALPNLMNKEGLPASPFRTDQ